MLSAKWLAIHAIAVGMVALFVLLGIWQLHRAEGGNNTSWAYALEWPSFALLVIGFWVKVVREEVRHQENGTPDGNRIEQWGSAHPATPRQAALDGDAAELAAFNRYVAQRARLRSGS